MGSEVAREPEGKDVRQYRREVQHATFSQLTQPNPKPSVIDEGNLRTCKMCLFEGETYRSHEINENGFTKNSVLLTDQGNLRSRLA